jgi:hypothetical protein
MAKRTEDLDEHWPEIMAAIEAAGMRVFPATIDEAHGIARWPQDHPFSAFLDHATQVGVRILYVDRAVFDEDNLNDLRDRVLAEETTSEYRPIRASMPAAEPTTSFPELEAFISKSRRYIGRVWAIEVQWLHGPIVHSYLKLAKWYSALLDELPSLKARLSDLEFVRDEDAFKRHAADLETAARALSSTSEFRKSKKTLAAIRRLAAKALPEASLSDLSHVTRSALELYETEILPEEERLLALKARSLLDDGHSLTMAAAKLGMTTGRLQRLIARLEE